MRPSRLMPLLLAVLLAAGSASAAAAGAGPKRVAVISCDGLGDALADRLLAEGLMPNLARLREAGVEAEYSQANFATKTAAGHAVLWTGAYGAVNGISGNAVPALPRNAHTILEQRSGFSSTSLRAEPIFVTAAREGKRVIAYNVPQTFPASTYAEGGAFGAGLGDRLTLLNGFEGREGHEGTWSESMGLAPAVGWRALPESAAPPLESAHTLLDSGLFALFFDDPADLKQGYDTCWLTRSRSGQAPLAVLKPDQAAWSPAVGLLAANKLVGAHFRLFELDAAGKRFLLYHTQPARLLSNRPAWTSAFYAANQSFVEGGATGVYVKGGFGRTYAEGGDGLAERRYLETVRFAIARLRESGAYLARTRPWDLFLSYLPFPDEAVHMWYGYLTPGSPSYDPALAAKLWPVMREIAREVDGYIGGMRQAIGPDAALVVASDHGMSPLAWNFHPNVLLRRAGLLTLDAEGKIDLARTKVMYGAANSAYFVVNTTNHKGGIVPPAQAPAVLAELKRAMALARTPEGKPIVTGYLSPTPALSRDLGVGGEVGGDLYLDLAPGYYLATGASGNELVKARPRNASGGHMLDPRRPELRAVFYAAGPGLKQGKQLGPIRQTDVAPTVARLLGIRPPAQATGRVLSEGLE